MTSGCAQRHIGQFSSGTNLLLRETTHGSATREQVLCSTTILERYIGTYSSSVHEFTTNAKLKTVIFIPLLRSSHFHPSIPPTTQSSPHPSILSLPPLPTHPSNRILLFFFSFFCHGLSTLAC